MQTMEGAPAPCEISDAGKDGMQLPVGLELSQRTDCDVAARGARHETRGTHLASCNMKSSEPGTGCRTRIASIGLVG